jgi:branched-subunit amino acid transport protein
MSHAMQNDATVVAGISLVVGPLLMSTGDLIHPQESMDPAVQAAVIMEHATHASRWYISHLLLFFGILTVVPGTLAVSRLTEQRAPRAGYAARVLSLIGVAAFAAIFVGEMLIGRYVSDGADVAEATKLLATFQSGPILGAVMVGGVAFFLGVAAMAFPLIRAGGPQRWPALAFVTGALLIGGEIATAQVVLSQIGNLCMLAGGVLFAPHVLRASSATYSPLDTSDST